MQSTVLKVDTGLVREAKVDEVYHAKVSLDREIRYALSNLFDKTDALVHI